ncbi:hypothetical protein SIAM614_28981 [Stappia aggregata IAM 12614]|uniref:Uncharacterized protein n=1 Tax=Roseibium aggregatum (strain ATCC 25650 / DSM 13394 / JCM 20685 / NBRC 16684 / NCIMB 2208 / IAM 12614 / B1) TaxID=384765 RepID=A0P116_ROSAI|nr:hypothetical protein SIAM614_28981 [Stappia aggregata IAM 12614] [Roseibium aggregatum IAM 12614]
MNAERDRSVQAAEAPLPKNVADGHEFPKRASSHFAGIFSLKTSAGVPVGVFDGAFLPGITEPGLCSNLCLKMRPRYKLGSTVERDGFSGADSQGAHRIDDLAEHQMCFPFGA